MLVPSGVVMNATGTSFHGIAPTLLVPARSILARLLSEEQGAQKHMMMTIAMGNLTENRVETPDLVPIVTNSTELTDCGKATPRATLYQIVRDRLQVIPYDFIKHELFVIHYALPSPGRLNGPQRGRTYL